MPLARIVTRFPEDALALVANLRTRGYDVETASPDETSQTPAQLKIVLEECETAAALDRADESPTSEDLCVFVAPGAITERVVPIEVVRLEEPKPPAQIPVLLEAALNPLTRAETQEEGTSLSAEATEASVVAPTPVVPTLPPPPEIQVTLPVVLPPSLKSWPGKPAKNDAHFLRVATIVAIIAVATLLLGESAHRLVPGPGEAVQHSEAMQPVWDANTTAPAPVTVKQEAKTVAAAKPRPAVPPHRATYNPESDLVAKDVVIHYRKQPPAPRLQAQKKPGVKYYSDLK